MPLTSPSPPPVCLLARNIQRGPAIAVLQSGKRMRHVISRGDLRGLLVCHPPMTAHLLASRVEIGKVQFGTRKLAPSPVGIIATIEGYSLRSAEHTSWHMRARQGVRREAGDTATGQDSK